MNNPFVVKGRRIINKFGKAVECPVMYTQEAADNPDDPDIRVIWIERPEELYGSHHYTGQKAVQVMAEDFRRAARIGL